MKEATLLYLVHQCCFPGVGSPASNSKVSDWLLDIEEHLEAKGVFLYEAGKQKKR